MKRAPLFAFLAALSVGAFVRFHDIAIRPLHHDEGVNCLFLFDLVKNFNYHYDPENYHGPLLYFMVAPLLKLLGYHTEVLRFWPAAIGTLTLAMFYPLRQRIGEWGAVAATWLLALSPVTVYFNRDLIHESWFVGSAALIAGSIATWTEDRRQRWIVLGWVGAAAMIATKETAPILLFALAAGVVLALLLERGNEALPLLRAHLVDSRRAHLWGATVATAILLVLFTSLFTNRDGFADMFRAYSFWTHTGTHGAGHEKPWPYFFDIAMRYEGGLLVLGSLGFLLACTRREAAAGVALPGFVLLAVHSLIPYKTPWLIIGFLPWLAAGAGYLFDRALGALVVTGPRALRPVPPLLLIGLLLVQARETNRLSHTDYDDEAESIVYAQTRRGFIDLVAAVNAAASVSPLGADMPVDVLSADHFPLNWYVAHLNHIAYWAKIRDDAPLSTDGISLVSRSDFDRARQGLVMPYRVRTFDLRPGVELSLFMPEELFNAAAQLIAEGGRWTREGPLEALPAIPESEVPTTLKGGLVARGYQSDRVTGTPVWVKPMRPVNISYDHGENSEWTGPFTIEWTGFLLIAQEGLHRFALESDDGSTLVIDGRTVVDNWGQHPQQRREGAVLLAPGAHRVSVSYQDFGGGARLFWKWRQPAARVESTVFNDVLRHDVTTAP